MAQSVSKKGFHLNREGEPNQKELYMDDISHTTSELTHELHFFSKDVAIRYGLNVATFLHNLKFWIVTNIRDKKNYKEGRTWSYKSQRGLLLHLPYLTRQELRTVIKTCVKEGLILLSNFNKRIADKTSWFAFTEKGAKFYPEIQEATKQVESTPVDNSDPTCVKSTQGWVKSTQPWVKSTQRYQIENKMVKDQTRDLPVSTGQKLNSEDPPPNSDTAYSECLRNQALPANKIMEWSHKVVRHANQYWINANGPYLQTKVSEIEFKKAYNRALDDLTAGRPMREI